MDPNALAAPSISPSNSSSLANNARATPRPLADRTWMASFFSPMSSLEILPYLNFLLPRPIEQRNLVDGSERHSRNLQRVDIHGLVRRDPKLHVPAGFLGS